MASTITSIAASGSAAQWVMRSAAWWKTVSQPATRLAHQRRSRMSPSTRRTRPLGSAAARLAGRPRTMLSTTTISAQPSLEQQVDDVRADEAGAAGDEHALAAQDVRRIGHVHLRHAVSASRPLARRFTASITVATCASAISG